MEREELKGKAAKDVVDSGGGRESVCGCGCQPLVQKTDRTEMAKEGKR